MGDTHRQRQIASASMTRVRPALATLRAGCRRYPWRLRGVVLLLTGCCWWWVPGLVGDILSVGIGYLWSRLEPSWEDR